MPRKRRKGYYVDGTFVTAGDDAALAAEDDAPSRTARKHASQELQRVGEQLVDLRSDELTALPLPDTLRDAILEAKRITSFGAQRRQAQFIGKLMRRLDADALEAVRSAIEGAHRQSAQDTRLFHSAEQWRDALLQDDERLDQWLSEFPGTDVERLRTLVGRARAETREGRPGEARRRGSAYREIFTIVRAQLEGAARAHAARRADDGD